METFDAQSLAREFRTRVDALQSPKVPRVRPIRREFSRRISSARSEHVLELAQCLIDLDLRIWAYEVVHFHRPTLRSLDAATIESLGRGIADWASVDVLGGYLAGPAWVNRQISDRDVHHWARSPDRWWRRTALVTTAGLNYKTRGGYGDAPPHPRRLRNPHRRPRRHGRQGNVLGTPSPHPPQPNSRPTLLVHQPTPPSRQSKTRSPQQTNHRPQEPTQDTRLTGLEI